MRWQIDTHYGKYVLKGYLTEAYLYLDLDKKSKTFMVTNTLLGLFQYHRLPYGIANAIAVFKMFGTINFWQVTWMRKLLE